MKLSQIVGPGNRTLHEEITYGWCPEKIRQYDYALGSCYRAHHRLSVYQLEARILKKFGPNLLLDIEFLHRIISWCMHHPLTSVEIELRTTYKGWRQLLVEKFGEYPV